MENTLLIGLSRQVALRRELDVVANNMANVSTNGFKARATRFEEYLTSEGRSAALPAADSRVSYVIDAGNPIDFSAGAIERTGNPLDVAVKGDGFLVVQTPAGERYTRNGSLEIDAAGQLVTGEGFPLIGDNGPIVFGSTEHGFTIAPDGTVTTNLGQRGKLSLVRFADPRVIANDGANLFSASVPGEPAGIGARLEPGAIERSNVKPILEMGRLIEVNRAYASVASMLESMSTMRQSSLSRLAEVPA